MSARDDAAVRAALLDRDAAYARLDDLSDQLAAVELENRELRAWIDALSTPVGAGLHTRENQ